MKKSSEPETHLTNPLMMASFKEALLNTRHPMVLAGAGLSAASGIGTFRGAGGLWRKYDAISLATPQAFEENPSRVWQFYHYRREKALKAQPNNAHYALALYSQSKPRLYTAPKSESFIFVTQNVDELSRRAIKSLNLPPEEESNINYYEMHGELFRVRCTSESCDFSKLDYSSPICEGLRGTEDSVAEGVIEQDVKLENLPRCETCGALSRPGVVWFGEEPVHLEKIYQDLDECDLLLVVGTSSTVYPAAEFGWHVQKRGGKVAVFNLDASKGDKGADFVFRGPCEELLPQALGIESDLEEFLAKIKEEST